MIQHPKTVQWQYDERLDLLQKLMLSALKASLCVVRDACEMVNIHLKETNPDTSEYMHRQRHYRWAQDNEIYQMYFQDLHDDVKDFGESQLHKLMIGVPINRKIKRYDKDKQLIQEEIETSEPIPDKTAVIFFNKTKNKDRGYMERHEITTPEGIKIESMAPIILNVNETKTDERG